MKNISIKMMVMIVAIAAVTISCKKVDGPKPSTEAYLTSKTWTATSVDGAATDPDNCDGLVLQFGHNGTIYYSSGCGDPVAYGGYTFTDNTIKIENGPTWTVTSIDGSSFTATDVNSGEVTIFAVK